MKLSLTSGFVQKFASTLHSSLIMPAWELLQRKMARKHTYKPSTYRLDLALLASETTTVQIEDVTKNLSPRYYRAASISRETFIQAQICFLVICIKKSTEKVQEICQEICGDQIKRSQIKLFLEQVT